MRMTKLELQAQIERLEKVNKELQSKLTKIEKGSPIPSPAVLTIKENALPTLSSSLPTELIGEEVKVGPTPNALPLPSIPVINPPSPLPPSPIPSIVEGEEVNVSPTISLLHKWGIDKKIN
jgi:hypothetical protein